uniref:Uncharacterized protein n=1 Tax=Methylophaga nitratireducenticrescens TaxID=754476 RepID=I1XLX6_METNJ
MIVESGITGVHCRTGSLENHETIRSRIDHVHCRTGSLENKNTSFN